MYIRILALASSMFSYHLLNDTELTALLWAADSSAFAEVFDRYWDKVYIHAYRMIGDEDAAKDVTQELFVSLWDKLKDGDLRQPVSLAGYLYAAIRNRVLNHMRQEKTRNSFTDALGAYMDQSQHTIIEKISEKELSAALDLEIQNLPPKMRVIFEMSRKEHLSHKEISQELSISANTVKKQINNAIRIIKLKLGNTINFLF